MPNKQYSTLNLWLRSLIFSIYSITSMMLWSIVVVASAIFPLRIRHLLIRSYLRMYMVALHYICHITFKVEGLENIPTDRKGIVMSKHQSSLETLFLPIIFPAPAIILKKELFWLPFFGWGLALSDPIAIDRNNRASAMQQVITKGKKRLDAGRWVLVFPEGTRIPYDQVGNYRLGGARLAAATGYPIIPVAHNTGRVWPKRSFIKYPGLVTFVIGPPIESSGKTAEELTALTKDWIETTIQRLDKGV